MHSPVYSSNMEARTIYLPSAIMWIDQISFDFGKSCCSIDFPLILGKFLTGYQSVDSNPLFDPYTLTGADRWYKLLLSNFPFCLSSGLATWVTPTASIQSISIETRLCITGTRLSWGYYHSYAGPACHTPPQVPGLGNFGESAMLTYPSQGCPAIWIFSTTSMISPSTS